MKLFNLIFTSVILFPPKFIFADELSNYDGFELIMKCKNPVSNKEILQVLDFSSSKDKAYLIEYIGDDNKLGSTIVSIRENNNFMSKPGTIIKLELKKIDDNKFNFFACSINMNSSCMDMYVAPIDLLCNL